MENKDDELKPEITEKYKNNTKPQHNTKGIKIFECLW